MSNVRQLLSSGYLRAVAVLSAGQLGAAAVPILTAPILGRLYSPKDYGVLAAYMAIGNVLAAISTMQLSLAVISEKSNRRAIQIVALCQRVALFVALVAAVLGVFLYIWMGRQPQYAATRGWMLLLPATVMAGGSTSAIQMLANRMGHYGAISRNPSYAAVVTASVSIWMGWLGWEASGLFAGYFAGQAVSAILYLVLYRKMVPERVGVSWRRLAVLARRHRDFVLFTQPSEFVGTINLQLPAFMLTAIGAAPILGAFSRARQLISMPLNLLGSSIGQVFRQRAAEQFRLTGSCISIYRKTLFSLAAIGFMPTIIGMYFAPSFMRFYLGPKWEEAGHIARIIAPMVYLGLVTSPLSNIFYFQGRQREELILNVCGSIMLGLISAGALFSGNAYYLIYAYVCGFCAIYLMYLLRGWTIARGSRSVRSA
jgi:O-antigen/teichoic acid export membrane protein